MKNRTVGLAVLLVLLSIVFACEREQDISKVEDSALERVVMKLSPYEGDADTKTTYSPITGGFTFLWAEGDAVGIVSSEGSQLKFDIKEEYFGKEEAVFDGRGFALLAGSRYASYCPFVSDYNLDPAAIPVSYVGQVQVGNNNTDHLGAYNYSAAIGEAPSSGTLYFTYLNIGSPHLYYIPVPPGSYDGLTISVDAPLYTETGTINLNANDESSLIAISPIKMSNSLSLDLSEVNLESVSNLFCWMMVPPVDLSGNTIRMTLSRSDGSNVVSAVNGADCPANYRKVFSPKTSVCPAESSIGTQGGIVSIQLVNSSTPVEVSAVSNSDWINFQESSTEGRVTTYTFNVAENTGAERVGTISFTEASTGLVNTVKVTQQKAGTVIGIGGWNPENRSGRAN